MHPTRSAYLLIDGKIAGYFGQVNPVVCDKLDIDKPVYAGEIYYDVLKDAYNGKIVFKQISKFPVIERDLAILIDDAIPCDKIIDCIKNNAGEFIDDVKLFDVYKGNQVESGKKSMAFNLLFVSTERTLSVGEIDLAIQNILKALRDELGAILR